jgi:DNA-binding HxlR family transcriptional regulator
MTEELTTRPNGPEIRFTTDCPGRAVFNHIASRWGLLILVTLYDAALRFHQIRNCIEGVSEKMLTQTLKVLVRDGLVVRFEKFTAPPQVTYQLSPVGRELAAPLREVILCLGRKLPEILEAQSTHDRLQEP